MKCIFGGKAVRGSVALVNIFAGILISVSIAACADITGNHRKGLAMTKKTIEAVFNEHSGELMAIPGVVGTAIGLCSDDPCIKVFVQKSDPESEKKISARLDGYPVAIEVIGEVKAL